MLQTINALFRIRTVSAVNRLLYYVGKLPVVGRLVPVSAYGSVRAKSFLSVFIWIGMVLGAFAGKLLFLWFAGVLPASSTRPDDPAGQLALILHVFLLMSLLASGVSSAIVLETKREKYVAVKLMRMNPGAYMRTTLAFRYILYFVTYIPALALIAGTRFTPAFSWDSGAALNTAWLMLRLLAVMLLGMPLLALITSYRLQQAVERLLAAVRLPQRTVWAVGLSVSLLFRFIPLMAAEWSRFARIGVARGKHPAPPGRVPVRAMPAVLVPFLLAMLQTADRVAVSLTLRGFDGGRRAAGRALPIRFTRRDAALVIAAAAVFALLRLIDGAL
mgnify:CR=1 FL=1